MGKVEVQAGRIWVISSGVKVLYHVHVKLIIETRARHLLPTSTFCFIGSQKINKGNGEPTQRLPIFAFGRFPG